MTAFSPETLAGQINPAAPGRSCGTCTLCCKVFDVPALAKPAGQWCRHCTPGRGCGIHETRPEHCRAFNCLWITEGWLGPEWKPERSKFVLTQDPATRFMLAQVDPGTPNAWRQEPYYRQFKAWAAAGLPQRRLVMIFVQKRATIVTPREDIDVGVMADDDRIFMDTRMTPQGPVLDLRKGKAQLDA